MGSPPLAGLVSTWVEMCTSRLFFVAPDFINQAPFIEESHVGDSPGFQKTADPLGRARLLPRQFRMSMHISTEIHHFLEGFLGYVKRRHGHFRFQVFGMKVCGTSIETDSLPSIAEALDTPNSQACYHFQRIPIAREMSKRIT